MQDETMTSAMCLVNRPELCKGLVISLAYTGPCICQLDPEPEPDPEEVAGDELAEEQIDRWEVAC